MANKFLTQFEATLDGAQRDFLKELIAVRMREGSIRSQAEARKVMAQFKTRGLPTDPIFNPRIAGVKLSSVVYNQSIDEILVDLRALFGQSNRSDKAISAHSAISKDNAQKLNERLGAIDESIQNYRSLVGRDQTGSVYEDFSTFPRQTSILRGIRTGQGVHFLQIEPRKNHIQENVEDIEVIFYPTVTEDVITERYPRTVSDHGIDNVNPQMPNADHTWLEIIASDKPIYHEFGQIESSGLGCTIIFTMGSPVPIDEIDMTPIATFPIDIRRIWYREDIEGAWQPLLDDDGNAIEVRVKDRTIINGFEPFDGRQIRFDLSQTTSEILYVAKNAPGVDESEQLLHALTQEADSLRNEPKDGGDNLKGSVKNQGSFDPSHQTNPDPKQVLQNSLVSEYGDGATREISAAPAILSRKHVYTIGASRIDLQKSSYLYDDAGVYISPKIEASDRGIIGASLSADDVIPEGTTIEYDLQVSMNNTVYNVPILPREYGPDTTIYERLKLETESYHSSASHVHIGRFPINDNYPVDLLIDGVNHAGTEIPGVAEYKPDPGIAWLTRVIWSYGGIPIPSGSAVAITAGHGPGIKLLRYNPDVWYKSTTPYDISPSKTFTGLHTVDMYDRSGYGQLSSKEDLYLPGDKAFVGSSLKLRNNPLSATALPFHNPAGEVNGINFVKVGGIDAVDRTSDVVHGYPPMLDRFTGSNWQFYSIAGVLHFNDQEITTRSVQVGLSSFVEWIRLRIRLYSNSTNQSPVVNKYRLNVLTVV